MSRRYTGHMKLHDLDNENANCQINEIIRAGDDVPFPSPYDARQAGYTNCDWCF